MGLIWESKRKKMALVPLSQWETVLFIHIRPLKGIHKQYVAAVLQVSILNGTDLKTMINYPGEQVSQRASLCRKLLHAPLTLCYLCFAPDELSKNHFLLLLDFGHFRETRLLRGKCSGNLCKWFWE